MSESLGWIAHGPAATGAVAEALGSGAPAGLVIGLCGPLGAGKTTFVQAFAQGLGVPRDVAVTSPTFALVHHYRGRMPLVHVDAYRVTDPRDLRTMDAEDWLAPDGVAVIEWADRVKDELPVNTLWCLLRHITRGSRELILRWPRPLPNCALESILFPPPAHSGLSVVKPPQE